MTPYETKKPYILKYQEKLRERRKKYKALAEMYEAKKITPKRAMQIFINIDKWDI